MTLLLETLIPLAVFLAITLGTWAILAAIVRPARQRRGPAPADLNPEDGPGGHRGSRSSAAQEMFQAKVTAAANKLGQSLRPSDEQELGKVRLKLLNAGFRQEQAVAIFFGIKVIGLLVGLAVAFPTAVLQVRHDADAMT